MNTLICGALVSLLWVSGCRSPEDKKQTQTDAAGSSAARASASKAPSSLHKDGAPTSAAVTQEDVDAFLQQWLAAQNEGNLAA